MNRQLTLIHSIKDSKIAENVYLKLSEYKTRIGLVLYGNLQHWHNDYLTENVNLYAEEHELDIQICHNQMSHTLPACDLILHMMLFTDFSIKYLVDSKGMEYVLFANTGDQISPAIRSNRNIQITGIENDKDPANIIRFLNSEWLLRRMYNKKEAFIHKEMNVIYKVLRRRNTILSGNIIINKGKEIDLMSNSAKALQLEANKVKQLFNSVIRAQSNDLENRLEDIFSIERPEFKTLHSELEEYVGYNEEPKGKIVTYSYPREYIESLKGQCIKSTMTIFEESLQSSKDNMLKAELDLISKSQKSSDTPPKFPDIILESDNFKKNLTKEVEIIKNEDRKAGYQGMSAIFSALKTPIYALFPLIMIARFIPSSDVGEIDHGIKMFENQSVVAVSKMPDTYDKSVTKFISAVNEALENGDLINRDTGKDMFKYSVDDKGRKKLEYSTSESGTQVPYVILPVYSDREKAAQTLMDNLLTIEMRMNIVSEIRKVPKILGPFERFFGPLLLMLIIWFVYSKRKSMTDQNEATQIAETAELKKSKLLELQNFIKSSESQAKLALKAFYKDYLEEANKIIEIYYAKRIEEEEEKRVKEMKLYKSREKIFQSEINNIQESRKKIYDTGKEYYKTINKNI